MLKNVGNAITRRPMYRFGRNLGGPIRSCPRQYMSAMMRLPWQWPLPSNGALNIQQLWASGGRRVARLLTRPAGRVGSENLQERAGRVQFGQRLKFNFKVSCYLCFILHFSLHNV